MSRFQDLTLNTPEEVSMFNSRQQQRFPAGKCLKLALLGLLLSTTSIQPVRAQTIPATLNHAEAGIEYELQGEYIGWQRVLGSPRSSRRVGLQIVSLGDGNFRGVRYEGGLPAFGTNGSQRFDYTGAMAGDLVRLENPNFVIEADGQQAIIFDHSGQRVGELKKQYRASATLFAAPPADAIVLFDGEDNATLVDPKVTPDSLLREGTQTADAYGDFRLHLEYLLPFKPLGRGQDRGNSGVYIQGRYEIQVLDTYGEARSESGGASVYRQKSPDLNVSLPPLSWQTYDIDFHGARFDASGEKIANATISLWHNGVLVHDHVSIKTKTGNGLPEGPEPLPIRFQDHSNPVLFRNVWILPAENDGHDSEWSEYSDQAEWLLLREHFAPVPYRKFDPAGLPVSSF